MGRPKKEYAIRRNGNSVQVYENGGYCGSLPLAKLCELARASRAMDDVLAQVDKPHKVPLKREGVE